MRREKREYSRVEGSWPASIFSPQGVIEGQARSLSLNGGFIHLRELPNLANTIQLAIEMPEYHYTIFVNAELVRLDVYEGESASPTYGLAVRFTDISEDDLRFLLDAVFP